METKVCRNCGTEKALTDWYYQLDSKAGKRYPSAWCKDCHKEQAAKWQRENRARKNEAANLRAARNVAYIRERKKVPCEDCGNSYPPVAMDFHHSGDDTKLVKVSALRGVSLEKVQSEIDKCVVLCAVCHRIRHGKELISA